MTRSHLIVFAIGLLTFSACGEKDDTGDDTGDPVDS